MKHERPRIEPESKFAVGQMVRPTGEGVFLLRDARAEGVVLAIHHNRILSVQFSGMDEVIRINEDYLEAV